MKLLIHELLNLKLKRLVSKKYTILLLFIGLFQFGNSQNVNTSLASDINTKFVGFGFQIHLEKNNTN